VNPRRQPERSGASPGEPGTVAGGNRLAEMTAPTTAYTRLTRVARRISASSGARVQQAHFAPCVLDLLGHARPQAHGAVGAVI
jgi:hypothetical protein